jgi:hypothetical protein
VQVAVAVGQVLAEAPPGAPATLRATVGLAGTRDAYLTQQRGDVVSITYLTTPDPSHTPPPDLPHTFPTD